MSADQNFLSSLFRFQSAFYNKKSWFGFNGKEKDNEVKGEGNSLDFGGRIYDSRLGRWLSLDPLMAKYPSMSPYNFCANNPIILVDPDGKVIRIAYKDNNGNTQFITYTKGMVASDAVPDYVNQVVETLNYLNDPKSNTASNIIDKAVKTAIVCDIYLTTKIESSEYGPKSNIEGNRFINWSPIEGGIFENGTGKGKSPPAVGLIDELFHFTVEAPFLEELSKYPADSKQYKEAFKNWKESRKSTVVNRAHIGPGAEEEEKQFDVEKQVSKDFGWGYSSAPSYFDTDAAPDDTYTSKTPTSTENADNAKAKNDEIKNTPKR